MIVRSRRWETIDHQSPRSIPTCGGVYAVFIDGELSYIGSTWNLRSRMVRHGFNYARYSNRETTPWGDFKHVTVKVKRSVVYGDWAMHEMRLLRRIAPRFNIRHVKRSRMPDEAPIVPVLSGRLAAKSKTKVIVSASQGPMD